MKVIPGMLTSQRNQPGRRRARTKEARWAAAAATPTPKTARIPSATVRLGASSAARKAVMSPAGKESATITAAAIA